VRYPQYGHGGQHHGTGEPGCPIELHHHHDERCSSELTDRRQRAREVFDDRWSGADNMFGSESWAERLQAAREDAIETATRVRITLEVVEAAWQASGYGGDISIDTYRDIIAAGFRAAGFEVEQ
jgi:hypothetical protein